LCNRKSLEDRSNEFEGLRLLQLKETKENTVLKTRLQELKLANENEKRILEQQVENFFVWIYGPF
jgi:hypothetical protein